jgi:hypothetical protein
VRRWSRWFVCAGLAALLLAPLGTPASGASGVTSPIGRAAAQAGYRVLHTVPLAPRATRVASIPRGLMILAGGSPTTPGPTEVTDLKEFFVVPDGASVTAWMDARHSSQLTLNLAGSSSWRTADGGRAYSNDSVWDVVGGTFPMQVAYNANVVSAGRAYLRVDVFIFWSPHFNALSGSASSVTLTVTRHVATGTRTVHIPKDQAYYGKTLCPYTVYKTVTEPLESLVSNSRRVDELEDYVNSRSDTSAGVSWVPGPEGECQVLQMRPDVATFTLKFFRADSTSPFATLNGFVMTDPSQTTAVAWTRSASGRLTAKSWLKGVSLSYLETYLKR